MIYRQAVVSFLYGDWPENAPYLAGKYVRRLYDGVMRNVTTRPDFWVITDTKNWDYVFRFLAYESVHHAFLPYWWEKLQWNLKKIYAYEPNLGLAARYDWVLLMDLDIVVTGNMDKLFEPRNRMVTCRGAYRDAIGGSIIGFDPRDKQLVGLVNYLKHNQAAIEEATAGSERKFLKKAVSNVIISQPAYWQDLLPGVVKSFKVDNGDLDGASIIRFHGSPRPHEVEHLDWMQKHWRGNGAH